MLCATINGLICQLIDHTNFSNSTVLLIANCTWMHGELEIDVSSFYYQLSCDVDGVPAGHTSSNNHST